MSKPIATLLTGLLVAFTTTTAIAHDDLPAADGPHKTFQDPLLDQLVGKWQMDGKVMGKPTRHAVEVKWVLGHQFLLFDEKQGTPPVPGTKPYQAMVFIGYDFQSERYVAHWLDVFGGRASETVGYGKREGQAITFVFEYPDGPFHNSFIRDAARNEWRIQVRTKTKDGKWFDFAAFTLKPAKKKTL